MVKAKNVYWAKTIPIVGYKKASTALSSRGYKVPVYYLNKRHDITSK
jgi:hypothetical protein